MSPSRNIPEIPDDGRLSILVVDDEPTLRLGFAYALSNKSTAVETASNGRQALERIAEKHFDIMILDLRMPELDGIGVLEGLQEKGNRMPVILCSAALGPKEALIAVRHGVVDFLMKPVRPVDLRQAIDFVMHPHTHPFSRGMVALRNRRFREAATLLESDPEPGPRTRCWLKIAESIRDDDDDAILEPLVRTTLPVIAFNSTVPS